MSTIPLKTVIGIAACRVICVLIALGIGVAITNSAKAQTAGNFSPEEIRQLVMDLGSDQFSKRQNAMLKLVAAGERCIREIEQGISLGDADIRLRGIGVLKILAIDQRSELNSMARDSLQRLAYHKSLAVARDAAATLHLVDLLAQSNISTRLMQLGAEISVKQVEDEGRDFSVPIRVGIPPEWNGTVADLLLISKLKSVTQLSFNNSAVDDALVQEISKLPNLQSLSIKRANISNQSVGFLARLDGLESLEILYCPIDQECIDSLLKCRVLSHLRLVGTGVSASYMTYLEEQLSADVDIRRGAFMGIYYPRGSSRCRLTNVAIGSGAEKAGLQPDDVIIGIDGHRIGRPTDLTKHLRSKGVGEKANIKFVRDGTTYEVEILFGEWE